MTQRTRMLFGFICFLRHSFFGCALLFIHLSWSDHGKHDNRLTLNPWTPLSSLSPSVSVSISCPTAVFLYFSVAFHCISSVILVPLCASALLLTASPPPNWCFSTSGEAPRWVVLNFEVSAECACVCEWEDRRYKETFGECMSRVPEQPWVIFIMMTITRVTRLVLFVHGLRCQCDTLEVYNIFTLFRVCLHALAWSPWAILHFC